MDADTTARIAEDAPEQVALVAALRDPNDEDSRGELLDQTAAAIEALLKARWSLKLMCSSLAEERDAVIAEAHEIEQVLGKALGYPRFVDDQATFPGATEADGVLVAPDTAATLAMQAAERLAQRDGDVARLRGTLTYVKEILTYYHDGLDGKRVMTAVQACAGIGAIDAALAAPQEAP